MSRLLQLFFFATIILFIDSAPHHRKHVVPRFRRDETKPLVRIISQGEIGDGTRIERIEEVAEELPPLPIDEEVDELDDAVIGHLDENGEMLVPIDGQGHVIPGYEHLIRPIVVEISVNDNQVITLPDSSSGSLPQTDNLDSKISEKQFVPGSYTAESGPVGEDVSQRQNDNQNEGLERIGSDDSANNVYKQEGSAVDLAKKVEDMGTVYDDVEEEEEEKQPIEERPPALPAADTDYTASAESGENLRPEVSAKEEEEEVDDDKKENVLAPDAGELGDAVPFVPVSDDDKQQKPYQPYEVVEEELKEAEVEALAREFAEEVFEKIYDKAGDIIGIPSESEVATEVVEEKKSEEDKRKKLADGYRLEDEELTQEELEEIRRDSEKKASDAVDDQVEGRLRSGQILPPKPSSTHSVFSISAFILTFCSLLFL